MTDMDEFGGPPKDEEKPKPKPKPRPERIEDEDDEDDGYDGDFVTPRRDDHGDDDEPLE